MVTALDELALQTYVSKTGEFPPQYPPVDALDQSAVKRYASFLDLRERLRAGYWENEQDSIQRRVESRRQQFALEGELGRELASKPPRFVTSLLGRPPADTQRPGRLLDRRGSAELNRIYAPDHDDSLTHRQLWERAAGALAGYVYGRGIVIDPAAPARAVLTAQAGGGGWPEGGELPFSAGDVHCLDVRLMVDYAARDLGIDPGGPCNFHL